MDAVHRTTLYDTAVVEVCSNGPPDTTLDGARLDTTMAGTRNPSWV
jgi:hypothetical protein